VLLVRGILAIAFGVLALVNPLVSFAVLVMFFGAYSLVDGVFSVVMSLTAPTGFRAWAWLLVSGIAGIVIGVLTFLWPGLTAVVLLYWILAWLVVTGAFQILAGIRLRKEITGEFWLILGGMLSVAFGLYLMANPAVGALAVLWMIACFALVFGAVMIIVAFRLRGVGRGAHATAAHAV
jgi:uncharacterized membrane protein HdeD (DUF308 family)